MKTKISGENYKRYLYIPDSAFQGLGKPKRVDLFYESDPDRGISLEFIPSPKGTFEVHHKEGKYFILIPLNHIKSGKYYFNKENPKIGRLYEPDIYRVEN